MDTNRIIYLSIIAGAAAYAAVLFATKALHGVLPAGGELQFVLQYVAVALTLGAVFAALTFFRKSYLLKLIVLEPALLADITLWQIYPETQSFLYMTGIVALAFVCLYPKKTNEQSEE